MNSAHLLSPFFSSIPPALFWYLFIRQGDSDRLTLLSIAPCQRLLANFPLFVNFSCNLRSLWAATNQPSWQPAPFQKDAGVLLFSPVFVLQEKQSTRDTVASIPAGVAAPATYCDWRWDSCASVCVRQPLHVGGSHPDIPVDVLSKGGALLMGTMHQLIVFFCGLVCHSSSAFVVIFLLGFTLEEQRLF